MTRSTDSPKIPFAPHATPQEDDQQSERTNQAMDDSDPTLKDKILKLWNRDAISLTLQNSGSVARDHLASERTFLAYVRTSLGVASAGVALTQFLKMTSGTGSLGIGSERAFAAPLGACTIGIALMILLIGTQRYFSIQRALPNGQFPSSRLAIAAISFVVGALVAATFAVVLADRLRDQ